ncbi:fungal-specific transcription factor domain-containing protein [Leptodontidium sp. 2 PMI_412]|nr:fungal-specific transcription factor domain-containing protein [Leptodontidium sp. 2 PMI_412]
MNSTTTTHTIESSLVGSTNGQHAPTWPQTTNPSSQPQLIGSCIHCRRRKVRCDKQSPCSNCVRFGNQCELAPRKRAPRKPRKPAEGNDYTGRELELIKRLNSLEGIVKELSGHVETNNTSDIKSPNSVQGGDGIRFGTVGRSHTTHSGLSIPELGEDVPLEKGMGTLMLSDEGKSRYVQDNFFSRLTDEVDDLVELFFVGREDEEETGSPETSTASIDRDHQSFVFGYASTQISMRDLHPLPSQLPFYLQMFSERVDILVKILHMPTIEALFKEAQHDLGSLSRSTEALMFAIYFAVITSMSVDEVKADLGCERKAAYDRYRFGVEQALARAHFLDTSDLTTLQAFVLYLAVVRCEDDTRVGWALMRSAIGVAQSMGLHRDGNIFKLSPFDVEMRRRLWWQICILDFRLSEKHGAETCTMNISFDTKRPLNVNDSDLHPEDLVAPSPRDGLTDVSIALVSCEISAAAYSLLTPDEDNTNGALHVSGKEERIQQFCQVLEEKYVKHCTDSTPMSWILSRLSKLVICKLESLLLLPLTRSESGNRDPVSKELYDKMFLASIEVVELRRDLESDITKKWQWYLRTIIQWHAVAYLLSELCVREPDDNVTRAWNLLDLVFQDYRDVQPYGAPALLMAPMKKLIARARRKRAQDLEILRAAETSAQDARHSNDATPHVQLPALDVPQAQDFFPGTFDFQDIPTPEDQTYGQHQQDWLQQHQQYPTMTPTPWLLEDSALQDLGIDMNYLGPDMEWEGLNDLMSQIEPAYGPNSHGPFGGW